MYKKDIYRIFIFLMVLFLNQAGFPFFKTQGKQIVDSTGTPFLFRGVGLGGWLVPEGYMLKIPGYGSPSYIDSLITDLIGQQNRDQFYGMYENNYVDKIDIEHISQWGFNSIRLPFHYKLLYDDNSGQFKQEGFALIDTLISWCKEYQLFLFLDMHCAPGGQNKDNISDSDGVEARLWTNPANQDLTILIWKEIATRYANERQIVGYDFINEPVLPQGYSNTVLRNFFIRLTDSIRTIDSNHIIFIEGNWYATDFNELTPPFDNNMVYSFHKYWNQTSIPTIQYLIDIRNQHNVPLWMGESGENSNPWFYETIQLLEQNDIGWCWWTHKKLETITSPLSAKISSSYQAVLNYWSGQAPRPSQSFATSALFEMAQSLALDQCDSRPGVLKALFDPNFGNQPQPFAQLSIPGTIDAVNYDFGTNAVGYLDNEYKNVSGPGGTSWNNGYTLRNDGVDIEKSSDPQGNAYNVGWIESGEWLLYTVNIETSGIYRAEFRVASQQGGGVIRLYVDGQPIGNDLAINSTGGWQNWSSAIMDSIELPTGIHKLYVSFQSGGFNLNRVNFFLVSPIGDEIPNLPIEFKLNQNFPNPFNAFTTIQYSLPESRKVKFEVFDIHGQKVAALYENTQTSGEHDLEFDGTGFASGIYLYRIIAGNFTDTKKMILLR